MAASESLLADLRRSLAEWDSAYLHCLIDMESAGEKVTEARLNMATRNELRQRGVELPEIVRWQLRIALGGVEEHE